MKKKEESILKRFQKEIEGYINKAKTFEEKYELYIVLPLLAGKEIEILKKFLEKCLDEAKTLKELDKVCNQAINLDDLELKKKAFKKWIKKAETI